eukprot:1790365-Rhodomonas_salina.2
MRLVSDEFFRAGRAGCRDIRSLHVGWPHADTERGVLGAGALQRDEWPAVDDRKPDRASGPDKNGAGATASLLRGRGIGPPILSELCGGLRR